MPRAGAFVGVFVGSLVMAGAGALLGACGASSTGAPVAMGAPSPTPTVPASSAARGVPARGGEVAAAKASDGAVDAGDEGHDRLLAATLAKVEQARQLRASRAVGWRVLERHALIARVRSHVEREVPREVVRGQGEWLVAFGLIPAAFDYENGVFSLLESQLQGYYETDDRTMYLARDLAEEDAGPTLAHELVHALQDQHHELGPLLAYRPDHGDSTSAVHALAEGEAMSAMIDVMLQPRGGTALQVPEATLLASMTQQGLEARGAGAVPEILRTSLIAPYVDGLRFVHQLRRRGGWAAVDAAWAALPQTTEQLLHLEKYDAREPALLVAQPSHAVLAGLGGGWRQAFGDVVGEQSLRLVLTSLGASVEQAEAAAAGWGGDRASLLRRAGPKGDEVLAVWRTRFDGDPARCADAAEAHATLARVIGGERGGARRGARRGEREEPMCRERAELGPIALRSKGCDVLVTAGPYRIDAGRRASAGRCIDVARWGKSLLDAR